MQPFHPVHEEQSSGDVVKLVVDCPGFRQEVPRVLACNHPMEPGYHHPKAVPSLAKTKRMSAGSATKTHGTGPMLSWKMGPS